MDPFKITCVTCSARLAVRDAALIGHIVACPRCGSMVQVTAPAASSLSPTTTSHATPAIALPVAAASVFDVADVGASLEDGDAAGAPFDHAPTPADPATAVAGGAGVKLAAIVLAGALAGSAVVAGTLAWLADDEAPPALAQEGKNPVAAPAVEGDHSADEAERVEEQDPAPATAADDAGVDTPALPTAAEESASDEAVVEDSPASATTPPPAPRPSGELDGEAPAAVAESTSDPPPAAAPTPRLRIDPLEIDPEGLDLSTLFQPRAAEPGPVSEIDEPAPAMADSDVPAEPIDADPGDVPGATQAVRRDADSGGAPGDVAVLLARRLPGVKVNEMPLCRFLDLAGQLSGVPVSVDPAELRLASVSAGAPVSVESKDATIEEVVAAAVKPLKLAVVVENSQLVLRRLGGDKRRSTACPVDDLTGAGRAANELAGWIQKLVAPETWATTGGGKLTVAGDTLQIDQREDVTYEAFILLERYRLARGLPTRTKYPAALLTPGSASAAVAARLAGSTTFTFSHYTPLREIFRWWQEELEVAVLVDWPALAADRMWPQTRIATGVIDKPWSDALDVVLEPLGLDWRPAGGRAIQITTLAKVRSEPVVELYRLAASSTATAEDLEKRVEQLAAHGDGSASKAATAVAYDAAHRVLLVRAPASVQRRLGESLKAQRLLAAD